MTERVDGKASTEVRSVARASRLLIAVASGETDGSGKALAEALGLAIPTAHHILSTLVAEGLLAKSESSRYYVGPRAAIVAEAHLRATAAPAYLDEPLRKLSSATGETTYLAAWRSDEIRMLKIVEGTRPVRVSVSTGDYAHPHARATGKVLLAHSTHEARDLYLQRHPLVAVTERTITDDGELLQVLDDVRTQGYALESEEYQSGVGCIAAPIFVDGHLLGAISVSVPMQRLTKSKDSLVDDVRAVAVEATEVLSGNSTTSHPRQKEMRS